jgi:hypothetical protein
MATWSPSTPRPWASTPPSQTQPVTSGDLYSASWDAITAAFSGDSADSLSSTAIQGGSGLNPNFLGGMDSMGSQGMDPSYLSGIDSMDSSTLDNAAATTQKWIDENTNTSSSRPANVSGGGGGGYAVPSVQNNINTDPALITRMPSDYSYNPITIGNPNYTAPTPTPYDYGGDPNIYQYGQGLSNAGADYGIWGTPYDYGAPQPTTTSSSTVAGPADNAINQPAISLPSGGGITQRPGNSQLREYPVGPQGQMDDGYAGAGMLTPQQRAYQNAHRQYMLDNPDAGTFDFDKLPGGSLDFTGGEILADFMSLFGPNLGLADMDLPKMAEEYLANLFGFEPTPEPVPLAYPDIHPVTGLPTKPTEGSDSWTQPETGLTFHNEDYNWNNVSPGQVAPLQPIKPPIVEGRPSWINPNEEFKIDPSGLAPADAGPFEYPISEGDDIYANNEQTVVDGSGWNNDDYVWSRPSANLESVFDEEPDYDQEIGKPPSDFGNNNLWYI